MIAFTSAVRCLWFVRHAEFRTGGICSSHQPSYSPPVTDTPPTKKKTPAASNSTQRFSPLALKRQQSAEAHGQLSLAAVSGFFFSFHPDQISSKLCVGRGRGGRRGEGEALGAIKSSLTLRLQRVSFMNSSPSEASGPNYRKKTPTVQQIYDGCGLSVLA